MTNLNTSLYMEATHELSVETAPAQPQKASRGMLLQHKCACGGSAGINGDCESCQDKRLTVQRYSRDHGTFAGLLTSLDRSLLSTPPPDDRNPPGNGLAHTFGLIGSRVPRRVQTELAISEPTDQYEQEADRLAEQVTEASASGGKHHDISLSHSEPLIQRAVRGGSTSLDDNALSDAPAEAAVATPTPAAPKADGPKAGAESNAPVGLIVEDDVQEVGPGQMRKTQLLDQLRTEVCAAADAELAAVGSTSEGCPYIERWIGHYRTRNAQYVERALRRYAPEAAGVSNARDYIPLVAARVRRAVAVWATTGRLTGVPADLASELAGGGMLGAVGGILSSMGRAATGLLGGVGGALRGIFTKAKDGGARELGDPEQIQARLSSGKSLDAGVKSRMENAFGHDFSSVRVHSDSRAAELSSNLNARAFTIGSDIAFAAGEYRPGTLVGDALLAHELAHVVQQGGATGAGPLQKGQANHDALEEDADQSAVSAVVSTLGGSQYVREKFAHRAKSSLQSGLSLQRCAASNKQVKQPVPHDLDVEVPAPTTPVEEAKQVPAVKPTPPAQGDLQMPVVLHFVSETAPFVQFSGREEYNRCGDKLWDSSSVTTASNSANSIMSSGFGISLVQELDNLECIPRANIVKGYKPLGQWIVEEVIGGKKRNLDRNRTHIFFLNQYEEGGKPSRTVGEVYEIGGNLGAVVKLQSNPGQTLAHELGHTLDLEHHEKGYGLAISMKPEFNTCGDEANHLMNWDGGMCVDRWMRAEARKFGKRVGRLK